MAAEALVTSDDRFHAAMVAYSMAGGKFADYLPNNYRPWMKPEVQDSPSMKAALGL